ncbi:MAG: tyrosine-type recombinase/integrase [Acidimicrobiales bacterium]
MQILRAVGLAPASIRYAAGTLERILALAIEQEALAANPANALRITTSRHREVQALTVEQVEALAAAIAKPEFPPAGNGARTAWRTERPDLALWVRLAGYCGLRAGELAALRRENIDLERGVLIVNGSIADLAGTFIVGPTKTGHRRAVPLPHPLISVLRLHLASQVGAEASAFVFAGETGKPIRHANLYRRHFRPAVQRAGLPSNLRFHDLRHTYAALLISLGAHPRAIMERMGHSSVAVTLGTYGHLLPGLDEELTARLGAAIEAEKGNHWGTYGARPPDATIHPIGKSPSSRAFTRAWGGD